MSEIVGPYKTLTTADGLEIPWYVMPFDKRGRCKAPRTRQHLLDALSTGGYTHVFLFSHGWNNDWSDASERYEEFVTGFADLRQSMDLPNPPEYRPLLVGVFWPSTSLVLPWERGPRFAGGDGSEDGAADEAFAADFDQSLDELAEGLSDADHARFYELAGADELDADGVRELARLLAPAMEGEGGAEAGADGAGDDAAADWAEAWLAGARLMALRDGGDDDDEDEDDFGTSTPTAGGDGPEAAGLLDALDPRVPIRLATVWKMKDRAGLIGAHGVHPLLRDVLGACDASLHLVGHSYGCKVMLSAVAYGDLPRTVTSALLLQPAFSHRAFAVDADGKGNPGGYRVALPRIEQPVVATFSAKDFALAKTFHLAVRRKSDLGEQRIAGTAPSRFAALGGYGPGGMANGEDRTIDIKDPGEPYDELGADGLEVLALHATRRIKGHGDIVQPVTFWALFEQVRRG